MVKTLVLCGRFILLKNSYLNISGPLSLLPGMVKTISNPSPQTVIFNHCAVTLCGAANGLLVCCRSLREVHLLIELVEYVSPYQKHGAVVPGPCHVQLKHEVFC